MLLSVEQFEKNHEVKMTLKEYEVVAEGKGRFKIA